LDEKIARQTLALIEQPELYKIGRVRGMREMVLTAYYVLVYRVNKRKNRVEIVRIVGARQDYPRTAKWMH